MMVAISATSTANTVPPNNAEASAIPIRMIPTAVRVANSLKVMRHLDRYATLTTEHFELRYDPEKDKLLAEFLGEYLEEVHAELKRQFNYEPPGKVLIEVFNSHEMFSGRTIGLPDLHTIGACTGKVVVMASPAAKGFGPIPARSRRGTTFESASTLRALDPRRYSSTAITRFLPTSTGPSSARALTGARPDRSTWAHCCGMGRILSPSRESTLAGPEASPAGSTDRSALPHGPGVGQAPNLPRWWSGSATMSVRSQTDTPSTASVSRT